MIFIYFAQIFMENASVIPGVKQPHLPFQLASIT